MAHELTPSPIHVERLTAYSEDDAVGIGELMPILSGSFTGAPIPEERLRAIIESPYHEQLVARHDTRIIGAATLSIIIGAGAGNKAWLEDFVASPDTGIRGIGQALWDEIEVWCIERSTNLEFTSRPSRTAAHAFYTKNGAKIRETATFKKEFQSNGE